MASVFSRLTASALKAVGLQPIRRSYAGAQVTRLTSDWFATLLSADQELRVNLRGLRARSRELCRNNGEAAGFLRDLESDIVGAEGALLQMRFRVGATGQLRESINRPIEEAYAAWSARGVCTTDGYHDRASLARLMIRTVAQDGEFLARRVRGVGEFGYQIQPLDADMLDETFYLPPDANGTEVRMGVELNSYGRPTGYYLWDRHPWDGTYAAKRIRYDASEIHHVFVRLRPGQTRGVPWFTPVLIETKTAARYTEAELMQSLLAAAQGGFFVNADGQAVGPEAPTEIDPRTGEVKPGRLEFEVEPGVARQLPPGWDFKTWTPAHPTANFTGFMNAIKRGIARGVGRSYASYTGDLTQVNYSSIRTDRIRETDFNRLMQQDLLVGQFERLLFMDWLDMARLSQSVQLPPTVSRADILKAAKWQLRGWQWVDPRADAEAMALKLALGVTTRSREAAALGLDYYDLIDERAEEDQYARDRGVQLSDGPMAYLAAAASNASSDASADATATTDSASSDVTADPSGTADSSQSKTYVPIRRLA